MAQVRWTSIRSFIAGISALVLVALMAAFAAAAMDIHVPILSQITDAMGITNFNP